MILPADASLADGTAKETIVHHTLTHSSSPTRADRLRATARRSIRLALGGVLVAAAAVAGSTGVAAATGTHVSDVITYSSHAYLTPPQAGPGRFVLVGDTCTIASAGRPAIPCTITGYGTVSPTGGTAQAVVTSANGVILLDEVYVFTSPTTLHGSGTTTKIARGGVTTGTFVGDFTAAPTATPNVLLDYGTITVSESN